jgi:hypothetical protein
VYSVGLIFAELLRGEMLQEDFKKRQAWIKQAIQDETISLNGR